MVAASFATTPIILCIIVPPKVNSVNSYSHFHLTIICLRLRISSAISLKVTSLVSLSFLISSLFMMMLICYRSFSMLLFWLVSIVLMC